MREKNRYEIRYCRMQNNYWLVLKTSSNWNGFDSKAANKSDLEKRLKIMNEGNY